MKKSALSRFYLFLTGIASMVIIQGCYQTEPAVNSERWTLKILLSDKMNSSKTIEPSISMTIATYDITGTCPGQTDVSISGITATQGCVEFDGLATGSWTFTVTGRNSAGTEIGSGQGAVSITQGVYAELPVNVTPLQGNGTLQLTASWESGSVGSNPVLTGRLTTPDSAEVEITSFTMDVSGNTATYSNTEIVSGYYKLFVTLTDGSYSVGGVTAVRIAAGVTSAGEIGLTVNNHGEIDITITQQMNDPVIVHLAGISDSITTSSSVTVAASASNATGVTYYWYIDGESVAANVSSYSVNGSTLAAGRHRLDVIAITSDFARAGSTSHIFTVTQ